MRRRDFLSLLPAAALAQQTPQNPLGFNTYCLRALKLHDIPLLDLAATTWKLDAIFLQDSLDPDLWNPAHWAKIRDYARARSLFLQTGGPVLLPKTADAFEATVALLERHTDRAKAMGSPHVRCLIASDRAAMPPGPLDKHLETVLKVLRRVRSRALDAGVKLAIENHKDVQAWVTRQVIDTAGTDFVASYLDTGNPVFVAEDPMTTLENLGPVAVCVHLRDSVIYEHPKGIAVQWVPLGEGVIDFPRIIARMKQVCTPGIPVYVKPITGRPPVVLPVYDDAFWNDYPNARSSEFARFAALARKGRPYEQHIVIEDLQGRPTPEHFQAAIQFQQRDHMERGIEYAKKTLQLGTRWRS